MISSRIGFIVARLVVAAFALVTAAYCLLAYIPFTYHQVHLGGLLPCLSKFAVLHPYLYWLAFCAAAITLPDLRNDRTRSLTVLFLFVYGLAGFKLVSDPLLVRLGNDTQDVVWCLVALIPLVWMAALDWLAQRGRLVWAQAKRAETGRLFHACLLSAVCVWMLTAAVAFIRFGLIGTIGFTAAQWAMVLVWSLASHLTVFMAIFLLLNLTGSLGRLSPGRPIVHAFAYVGTAAILVAVILRFVVFTSLSFSGWIATAVAMAMAFSIVAFASGISVRLYRDDEGAIESPLALLLMPMRFLRSTFRPIRGGVLVCAGAVVSYALVRVSKFDWAYVIQTLIVLSAWAAAFAFFYIAGSHVPQRSADRFVIAAAILLCVYRGSLTLQARGSTVGQAIPASALLDEYGNYDVGFRLAWAALSPRMSTPSDDSLYRFLTSNTNIPRSVRTDPVEINLSGKLVPTAGAKPNIFIFVIDSLRRDYLSPYNPSVTFTRAVQAFAHESFVAQNAFTRYAGTGLSEPSIWTGAMLLHKQYVTPFYPMNALQKLLEFERYRQFITEDEILRSIVAPSPLVNELDAGRPTMSCEFCQTLAELQARIRTTADDGQPIFAYTQPQNIHVSVINREGRSVPPGEEYLGFDAPYASRVRAMDKCFAQFIQFLKSSGLYDNSIVILTSDHGDSLGEEGKWGHAYNVVPEVVRVPLIIHLPSKMHSLVFDQNAVSFLVDIAPSLYYILGHRPIVRNGIFGRPLFTKTAQEQAAYARDSYLIASSYGPVYAILADRGRSLYVADAVEYKDHLYDLSDDGNHTSTQIAPELRADRQQQIREYVSDVNRFYRFDGADELARK